MKETQFWFYRFEGRFSDDAMQNAGAGVMSSCIVRADGERSAHDKLKSALRSEAIELRQVLENFRMDPDAETIESWVKDGHRCHCEDVYFDVWHTFAWTS